MSAVDASGVAIAVQSGLDPGTMVCIARCGQTAPPVGALLDINSGISGRAARENRTLLSEDTSIDPQVDREVCERLGIRSVVAMPLARNSRCIGILELFSSRRSAFGAAALSQIEVEAVRALALIDKPLPETRLPDPQNWEARPVAFRVDAAGRLSTLASASEKEKDDLEVNGGKISSRLEGRVLPSRRKHRWRWIALVSVASLAFSAPRLLHRANAPSATNRTPSIAESTSGLRRVRVEPEATAALVSDAAPSVRVLMAKAVGGSSIAQAALADHYALGDGVSKDPVKAAVWAIIASTNQNGKRKKSTLEIIGNLQRYEIGQVEFNLGAMSRDGIGTPRNLVNAYSWFSLCAQTGDVRANAALLNLEQVMSAGEIAKAQQHAPQLVRRLKP